MSELHSQSIPNKLYFRIGEVSDIVGVKPYVLRYWESEFPDIKPSKSKSGQRLYKRRDVETLLAIKTLLYEERFTINCARKRLKDRIKNGKPSESVSHDHIDAYEENSISLDAAPVATPVTVKPVSTSPARSPVVSSPERVKVAASLSSEAAPDLSDRRKLLTKVRKDLETLLKLVREDI